MREPGRGKVEVDSSQIGMEKGMEMRESDWQYTEKKGCTEAEFLDVIGTKVVRVFLLAIHSHLY